MAINPEISLGVRPPVIAPLQIQSPLEQFGKVLTLRNLMQEQQSGQIGLQAQQLKLQQEQKGIQEDADLRNLLAKNPNPSHAEIISTIGPVRGAALIKSQSDQLQQFYKTEGERYNLLGRLAGSATDKTSAVDAVMRATASSAFDTDPQKNAETGRKLLDHLNTNGFNPAEFKQFQLQAMDAAQQHTAQLADVEDQRKATLAPIELATKQAEAEQKQRQIEASRLAPALARGAVAFQQELAKMKPERAALYSGFRDPSELYAFAMTPHEQVMAQQAASTAAETARHNLVTETSGATTDTETARHNKVMEARMAKAAEAGLNQAQNQRVIQIANQFDNEPIVKNYNTIAEGANFANSLGTGAKGNAGDDQALLYAFAKAMDPGSVVREGEYATVQKYAQSWADTYGFKAARVFTNSPFLSDESRKLLKDTIAKKVDSAKQAYDNVHNEYGRRIELQAGVKGGKDYLTNYGQAFSGAPGAKKAPPVGTVEDGHRFKGGDPSKPENWEKQ